MSKMLAFLVVALSMAGCGPAAPAAGSTAQSATPTGPKRIVAAITGDPHTVYSSLNPNSQVRGVGEVQLLLNRGLTITDNQDVRVGMLAEAAPTVENGLWKVFPDGRMETIWTIKQGAQWHDGTPYTTADLLFTTQISRDPDLPILVTTAFRFVESVDAIDARTISVRWKEPYISADGLFGTTAQPVARHLLEPAYLQDKIGFTEHLYWSVEFIGMGPYQIKSWERGSHTVLAANDAYILGRPKIDEIEVRFIQDANTLVANTLAGAIDATMGRGISLEQGITVKDLWKGGYVDLGVPSSNMTIWPQLLNPTPPIVGNLQFRRALLHGLNRQEMVDTIQFGMTAVTYSGANPREPEFPQIDAMIVKYEYDPRKAAQMLADLGYVKAADGALRDTRGNLLEFEYRTITGDINLKTLLATTDQWRALGLGVDPVIIPSQRQNDRPYRSTFPALELLRPNPSVTNFHSSAAPLPENNFVGSNRTRYMNPELDALIDRHQTTIPRPERMRIAGQIWRFVTENVLNLALFADAQPNFVSLRLKNVTDIALSGPWNVHEWEVS